jgi:hypothetical protein
MGADYIKYYNEEVQEICKDFDNTKLKTTKNGKWAVHLQMVELGGWWLKRVLSMSR